MPFNKKLKSLRLQKGLYQHELAKLMHVAPYNVSNWEQGRAEPCLSDLRLLCQILNCTADELLELDFDGRFNDIDYK